MLGHVNSGLLGVGLFCALHPHRDSKDLAANGGHRGRCVRLRPRVNNEIRLPNDPEGGRE